MSEASRILVQGGTQGMRAWVRNIAAMALAADPNRTHQSVKVMGSETAFIRYLGQGRCVIRITGDEARQGIAFQLLHDQQLQPQWYTAVYDAEDKAFKVRKTAPPQYDSTWYGTRETDEGTVVERKVHWYGRPKKPSQRGRLLGAGGPKSLAEDERILAAAPGPGGRANLLICRGEVGKASQVLARWWASSSSDWQDTAVMDVPAFRAPGGDPRGLILCSGFSPDGKKVTVAAQRAGCWDVTFRDGAQPALKRLYDADVLPGDLLGFAGGQNLEFMRREDIGVPEYFGHYPGTSDGAGYQEESCWVWDAEPPSGKEVFTDYAVQRKTVRRRIEIDTLDLQRRNDAPDALMWVKREIDAEQHLHELAQPSLRASDDQKCEVKPENFFDLSSGLIIYPGGPINSVHADLNQADIDKFVAVNNTELLVVNFCELGHPVTEARKEVWHFPEVGSPRTSTALKPPWYYEYWDYNFVTYRQACINGPVDESWHAEKYMEESFSKYLPLPGHGFIQYVMKRSDLQWLIDHCEIRKFDCRWKNVTANVVKGGFRYTDLGGGTFQTATGGASSESAALMKNVTRPDVVGSNTVFVLSSNIRFAYEVIDISRHDQQYSWFVIKVEPYIVTPGRVVSGYTSNPDMPWAQLNQVTTLSTSHYEVRGKLANLVKQQTMTTKASIVTEGSDPYESATRKIERTTMLGANTSSEGRAMMTMPVVANLDAQAKLIDNVTGAPVGAAINGFNSPGISDFSFEQQGDKDLVFPGFWATPQEDSKHKNYFLHYPLQDTVLLREIWAFDKKIAEIRIGERPAGGATELLRYAAVDVSTKDIPIGTGRDQEVGEARRIDDYGLQHIGHNFSHGGRDVASTGYKGDFYGTASGIVFGYGGAIGSLSADFISTIVYNSFSAPWEFKRSASAGDATMLSWMYNYGGGQGWESFEGRVCDVAYSPEAQITVMTARGTAHVAHQLEDGTVVHANLLQLLGKANAQGYSRDWWVVNLVEL